MSLTPLVSINLCCYNSEKYLEETLQSIFGQTYKNWELVVVNDGSTDSTEQIIRQHIAEGYPIRYQYQENKGLGFSRNRAVELSAGEIIALIDHDDLWLLDKLAQQVKLFEQPKVGLVYSDAFIIDTFGKNQLLVSAFHDYRLFRGQVLDRLFMGNFIVCSTVAVRRKAMQEVGLFNPSLRIAEEYDLYLRLASHYEFDFVNAHLAKWRVHNANSSWNFSLGKEEEKAVLLECLARDPELNHQIPRAMLRLRLSGFGCSPGQVEFMKGRWVESRAYYSHWTAFFKSVTNLIVKYVLSFLPSSATKLLFNLLGNQQMRRYSRNYRLNV